MVNKKSTPKSRAAARSKAKQGDQAKFTKSQLARPGKIAESGMTLNSLAKLGQAAVKSMTTPKAGTPRLAGNPPPLRPGARVSAPKQRVAATGGRLGIGAVRPRPAAPSKPAAASKPSASSTSSTKWSSGRGVQGKVSAPGKKPVVGKKSGSPVKWSSKSNLTKKGK